MAAMLNVLDKRWLSQGWRPMEKETAQAMAVVWIEALDLANIPFRHYEELFRRAVKLRARRYEQGLKCDDFSVDLMIACWAGLAADLRQQDINSGRMLTTTAASDCDTCFGTGMEIVKGKGARACTTCRI